MFLQCRTKSGCKVWSNELSDFHAARATSLTTNYRSGSWLASASHLHAFLITLAKNWEKTLLFLNVPMTCLIQCHRVCGYVESCSHVVQGFTKSGAQVHLFIFYPPFSLIWYDVGHSLWWSSTLSWIIQYLSTALFLVIGRCIHTHTHTHISWCTYEPCACDLI